MFLEKLHIIVNNLTIREVAFKSGLNLIVDKSIKEQTKSGNSVGKTTLLRVIDYCFGSDGKDIYTDQEFRERLNMDVHNWASKNHIDFLLETRKTNGTKLSIRRNFSVDGRNFFQINDSRFTNISQFKAKLFEEIFGVPEGKPTLRQLMPKFIRNSPEKMSNTIMYLHKTTTQSTYETIWLFLLGFQKRNLFEDKLSASADLKKAERRLEVFQTPHKFGALRQMLNVVERDIAKQEKALQDFQLTQIYQRELEELNKVRLAITQLTSRLSMIDLKIEYSLQTIKMLNENISSVDVDVVKLIYAEAKRLLPDLQKSYEDVVNFHNTMISKKLDFVKDQLNSLNKERDNVRTLLNNELTSERTLLKGLFNTGSLSDIHLMQVELNRLHERKGQISQSITNILETQEKIEFIKIKFEKASELISKSIEDFQVKLTKFNLLFSELSNLFYGEQYFLAFEQANKGIFRFFIDNMAANVGGGKKKGQVAAFDLAYIMFANELQTYVPRFVMHDSIEDVHANQIRSIFDASNNIKGQYIVAVLKDKIEFLGAEFIEENKIVELDENDRLFRI